MARFPSILLLALLTLAIGGATHAQVESRPLGTPAAERTPLGGASPAATSIGSTIASLTAVVAVIVACFTGYRFLAARAGGLAGQAAAVGAPAGILDMLGRYPIGRGQTLMLLKVDRRVLLVAQSAPSRVGSAPAMTTLCEISDPDEISSILGKVKKPEAAFKDVIATLQRPEPSTRSDGIEVVDLTRSDSPLSRLTRLGRKRA
ncbi:MAG: flagellar biosynthetic protein FliO [Planctomycetota bacterium]